MKKFLNEKVIPAVGAFSNFKAVLAVKNGFTFTVPITMIGSLFLLLANIPIKEVADWIEQSGLSTIFFQTYNATFGIAALVAVVGITYSYVKAEGFEPLSPAFFGLCTYILFLSQSVTDEETGITVSGVINRNDIAARGMITALIIGLLVGWSYSWFLKRNIRIKLPDSVPENVSNSFTSLVPGVVIIAVSTCLFAVLNHFNVTLLDLIYTGLQAPLQGFTDTLGGVLLIAFIAPFLWCFGIHGGVVSSGVTSGLLQSNMLENQDILNRGLELTLENGGHIMTTQFTDQLTSLTGNGITIGIVMYMLFFAKSRQYRELGKLGVVPAVFGINEPIIFSTPIVLNPIMFIPFVLTPVLAAGLSWLSMYLGLVPLFSGIAVPWTTPPIISGFICGGWRMALLHVVILTLSCVIYYPFIKKMDEINYKAERGE